MLTTLLHGGKWSHGGKWRPARVRPGPYGDPSEPMDSENPFRAQAGRGAFDSRRWLLEVAEQKGKKRERKKKEEERKKECRL